MLYTPWINLKKNPQDIIPLVVREARIQGRFAGEAAAIPYTPVSLIEEISEKVPVIADRCFDTKIAVLYTVEWALWLLAKGFQNITLITRTEDPIVDRIVSGWSQHSGVQGFMYMTEEKAKKTGMKFDVVVGNPPYQSTDAVNAKGVLWKSFMYLSSSTAKSPSGYIALVTPKTWTSNVDLYREYFLTKTTIVVNLDECDRHFPGVNSTFSYHVVINGLIENQPVDIMTKSTTIRLSRLPTNGLPNDIHAVSILQRFEDVPTFGVVTSSGFNTSKFSKNDPSLSKEMTDDHRVPVLHKTVDGIDRFFYAKEVDESINQPKVIVSTWVGHYDRMRVDAGIMVCQDYRLFLCETTEEAENLRDLLQLKLYKFIAKQLAVGTRFTTSSLSTFPKVDLSHSWTDEKLYQHFNLTQDEIDLIERTIK